MTETNFKFIEYRRGIGYLGEITLVVETHPEQSFLIEWSVQETPEWVAGANFGLYYAWEHAVGYNLVNSGYRIRVVSFRGHAVDTSSTVAAYVAAQALWQALGVNPQQPIAFDKENGLFVFPK